MEKISIIVPIYNGEKYLVRCLDSLVKQTYKSIEIILLNDGSVDNSGVIIRKYAKKDERIKVIEKDNTGVSDTRNLGIDKATGDYICFCDCDDMYHADYLQKMYDAMTKYKVDVVKCNFEVIDTKGKQIDSGKLYDLADNKYENDEIIEKIIPRFLNGDIPCFCHLIMIRKSMLKARFPIDIAMMEDVVFYLRLFTSIDGLYIIPDTLYTIMFNPMGATNNTKNYQRNILNVIMVNRYIMQELRENKILSDELVLCTNVNSLNSISDFIFRHYLYTKDDTLRMCKIICNDEYKTIVDETNLKKINLQRRIIIRLVRKEKYRLLHLYLIGRKIIFKLRRM